MSAYCKTCANFRCEVMQGDGKPLEDRGECAARSDYKIVDADDWCNKWTEAQWVKRESEENFRSPLPDACVCAGSSRPCESARHGAAGEADDGRAVR